MKTTPMKTTPIHPHNHLFVVAADSSPSLEQARVVMESESFKGGNIEVCFTGGHGVRSKRGNRDGSRNQFDSLNPSNDLSSMGIPECTMHQKMRFDDIGADARWLQRSHFLITPTDDAVLRETWTEKTIDDLISKQTMMISKSKICGFNIDTRSRSTDAARYKLDGWAASNTFQGTDKECTDFCNTLEECKADAVPNVGCTSNRVSDGNQGYRCYCRTNSCEQDQTWSKSLDDSFICDALTHPRFRDIKTNFTKFSTVPKNVSDVKDLDALWQRKHSGIEECENAIGVFYSPRVPTSSYHMEREKSLDATPNGGGCFTTEDCTDPDSYCRWQIKQSGDKSQLGTCMTDVQCQQEMGQEGGNGRNRSCKRIEKNTFDKKRIVHSVAFSTKDDPDKAPPVCQFFPDMLNVSPDPMPTLRPSTESQLSIKGAWYYGRPPPSPSELSTQVREQGAAQLLDSHASRVGMTRGFHNKEDKVCSDYIGTPSAIRDDSSFGGKLVEYVVQKEYETPKTHANSCNTYPAFKEKPSGQKEPVEVTATYGYNAHRR